MGDAEGGRRNFQSESVRPTLPACLAPAAEISAQTNAMYIYCAGLPWLHILYTYMYICTFSYDQYMYIIMLYISGELECGRQNVYVLSCCFAFRLVDL